MIRAGLWPIRVISRNRTDSASRPSAARRRSTRDGVTATSTGWSARSLDDEGHGAGEELLVTGEEERLVTVGPMARSITPGGLPAEEEWSVQDLRPPGGLPPRVVGRPDEAPVPPLRLPGYASGGHWGPRRLRPGAQPSDSSVAPVSTVTAGRGRRSAERRNTSGRL